MARRKAQQHETPSPRRAGERVGGFAFDNPVAAGGMVVMALTGSLIVANALGLQSGKHPAPLFVTRDRPALIEPEERVTDPLPQASVLVLDIQTELRRLHYYEGPLDGMNGPATEQAIRRFERSQGRGDTGRANASLLAVLTMQPDGLASLKDYVPVPQRKPRLGAVPQAQSSTVVPATSAAASETTADLPPVSANPRLASVQAILSDLGYGPLKADGVMGQNTSMAIQRFELDRGLPISGRVTPQVVARLEEVSGRKVRN